MDQVALLLFEREGLLLLFAFLLTRIPGFRQLLDKHSSWHSMIVFSVIFAIFGIAGTYAGVVISNGEPVTSFWYLPLKPDEAVANSTLVGVLIGGLLGGPAVGAIAGLLAGLHLGLMGGFAAWAMAASAPITGLLAGKIARFFAQERVISSAKSLFIGMFAPIVQMGLILVFAKPADLAISLVDQIGIPMVITNSVSIAVFTAMLRIALSEQERAAAEETQRALHIVSMAMAPFRDGLTQASAEGMVRLLKREIRVPAIAVTDTEKILAFAGIGADRFAPGEPIRTELSRLAIHTGETQVAFGREHMEPHHDMLEAAVIVPIRQGTRVAGLLKLYYRNMSELRQFDVELAKALGTLISLQLQTALAEKMTALAHEAELRLLQAQIHPHFLFNTLNSIVTLIRTNPSLARHITVQLGSFMRFSLGMTQESLVPLDKELDHLRAYLDIIRVRFQSLEVRLECDGGFSSVVIPPSTLQPLVENSLEHGLRNISSGGWIRVSVRKNEESIELRVEDNGTGIRKDLLQKLGREPVSSNGGNGIGVHNVNERLKLLIGPEACLHFSNRQDGQGSVVSFRLPMKEDAR